jgi:type II secretory pathway component GspD/PulD (secretin)
MFEYPKEVTMRALIFSVSILILSVVAQALPQTYNLDLSLSINGKHIFSPHLKVEAGKVNTVSQKTDTGETFIEVTASKAAKGIQLNCVIGEIDAKGVKSILSSPRIIALSNQTAEIKVRSNDSKSDNVALAVTASEAQ